MPGQTAGHAFFGLARHARGTAGACPIGAFSPDTGKTGKKHAESSRSALLFPETHSILFLKTFLNTHFNRQDPKP
jgi:hypothetical protein